MAASAQPDNQGVGIPCASDSDCTTYGLGCDSQSSAAPFCARPCDPSLAGSCPGDSACVLVGAASLGVCFPACSFDAASSATCANGYACEPFAPTDHSKGLCIGTPCDTATPSCTVASAGAAVGRCLGGNCGCPDDAFCDQLAGASGYHCAVETGACLLPASTCPAVSSACLADFQGEPQYCALGPPACADQPGSEALSAGLELRANWTFDCDGHDRSGNHHDLSLEGSAGVRRGPGGLGAALAPAGAGDAVGPPSPAFEYDPPFTLALWVFADSLTDATLINNYDLGTSNGWFLKLNSDGSLLFITWKNGAQQVSLQTGASKVAANGWHHLVLRGDTGGGGITVDGQDAGSMTVGAWGTATQGGAALRVGAFYSSTTNVLQGAIDEVAIWHRLLSDGEVEALRHGGLGSPVIGGFSPYAPLGGASLLFGQACATAGDCTQASCSTYGAAAEETTHKCTRACSASLPCGPGATCVQGYSGTFCARDCDPQVPYCPAIDELCVPQEPGPTHQGACLPSCAGEPSLCPASNCQMGLGVCGCAYDTDCPAGQSCDPDTGVCFRPCNSMADCGGRACVYIPGQDVGFCR